MGCGSGCGKHPQAMTLALEPVLQSSPGVTSWAGGLCWQVPLRTPAGAACVDGSPADSIHSGLCFSFV